MLGCRMLIYERLILDVVNGDKRLFIRNDELEVLSFMLTC